MFDSDFDNELMTLDTGLGDTTMAAQEQEAGTYWVITSRAKGGASSPFGGTAESNQTSQLVQMTEQQLRQEYQDSGQLQQQFGSFDNYMSYINDSQEWVQSAEWMLATPEYRPGSKEWAYINQEDIGWRPGEREEIEQKIRNDMMMARTSAYYQWMGGEEGQALMQKYGIQDTIYNDDGDQFRWTGSGYQKTIKIDDHASFADYATAILKSVVISLVTGAVTQAAFGAFNITGSDLLAKLPSGIKDFIRSNEILRGAVGAIADQLPGILAGGAAGGGSLNEQINGMFDSTWNNVITNLAGSDYYSNDPDKGDNDNAYDYRPPSYVGMFGGLFGSEFGVGTPPKDPDEEDSDNDSASDGGAGSSSSSSASTGGDSGGTQSTDGTTSPQETGGADDQSAGDIVGRQLHEAILRTTDPVIRQGLIREWERYTGQKYSDDFYDNKPVVDETDRTPIGYVWVPGIGGEDGYWNPVYDEDQIPTDGIYEQGATEPTGPPNVDWAQYCRIYPDDPVCAKQGAVTGGGNPGENSASGGGEDSDAGDDSDESENTSDTTTTTTTGTTVTTTPGPGIDVTGVDPWGGQGIGGGTGTGEGPDGSGSGSGGGDGDGTGGDGNGDGLGGGSLDLTGRGSFDPTWTSLPQGHVFVPYKPDRGKVRGTKYKPKTKLVRDDIYADLWSKLR